MLRIVTFFEDLSQSEKPFEIKPPFKGQEKVIMEDVLPNELLAVPLPPVALIGLQAMSSHAVLWRALSEGGGSNSRQIRWLLIDDPGNDLPTPPKARRTSYEWFIPKGKGP